MTATITATNGAGTTTPLTILSEWSTAWRSRNVIHDLTGGDIAISLVAPRPRAGSMDLLYETEADAFACVQLHRQPTTFTLTETDHPNLGMTYAVDGDVQAHLDEDTLSVWIVAVGYQELSP